MSLKRYWETLPVAYKLFTAILLFFALVEAVSTLYIWNVESSLLIEKERANLQRELQNYRHRLMTHLNMLQKEVDFLARLEIMDDAIAGDIDQRILTLLETKAHDLSEGIIILFTGPDDRVRIAPRGYRALPIHAFTPSYLALHAPVTASFDAKKELGRLYLLYPYNNLRKLHTDSPLKTVWIKPPSQKLHFPTPSTKDLLVVSTKLDGLLKGWQLFLAYEKEEALATLKSIEKVQLYTFLLSTLLLGLIVLILSRRLTHPLVELLQSSQRALEAKTTFLSTISHELRTPLGSILNLTQHLTLACKEPENSTMLRRIETSAQHLLAMINNILQLSKLEAKSIVARKEHVSLPDILEEVSEIIEPLVLEKDILFEKEIRLLHPETVTDANLLKQVMINLLSNAVKFTEKGKITVSLTESDREYRFTVTDTGIGIEKERQEALFTPFYQAHDSDGNAKESGGIGLALSQKVAHLLGGRISIFSEGLQSGTRATFTFRSL